MKAGFCIHYVGRDLFLGKKCSQGIDVRSLVKDPESYLLDKIPCIKKNGARCEKYTEPTKREIKKTEAELQLQVEKMLRQIPLMSKIKEQNPEGGSGVLDCPECGGRLHYIVSSYNLHCSAKCETKDCLRWME